MGTLDREDGQFAAPSVLFLGPGPGGSGQHPRVSIHTHLALSHSLSVWISLLVYLSFLVSYFPFFFLSYCL